MGRRFRGGETTFPHAREYSAVSLFVCSVCGVVENTACTTGYWANKVDKKPVLCSECADGKWHGQFPKRLLSETNYVVNANGTLEPPGGWPKPAQPQEAPK